MTNWLLGCHGNPCTSGAINLTKFGGGLNGKRDRQPRGHFLMSPKVEGLGAEGTPFMPFVRMSNLGKVVTHATH